MRKDNGITVYEETDKCALDEYSEQLAKDIEQKFENEAYDDTEIKQDISNIQAEQETQNINIESLQKENAEIKEENSRLKEDLNAFPTANGSGEYVTLDTADSRFKEFKISGKRWQETRSGKNAIIFEDVESTISGVTYSIKNGVVTLNGTATGVVNIYSKPINLLAGDYTLSKNAEGTFDKGTATSTPAILLQKKQEDGSYQTYSKYEIGAGATNNFISKTLEKGTYRLRIFTATGNILNNFSWKPQLEQGAVFSGFEQGGAMPSAEFPSEIRNVGDNINIFNKNGGFIINGTNVEVLDRGIRLLSVANTRYGYAYTVLGKSELLGKTIVAHSDLLTTEGTSPNIALYFGTQAAPTSGGIIAKANSKSQNEGLWNIPSKFPDGSDSIRIYFYIGGVNPAPIGATVDYNNLKVEIGKTSSIYSEYSYGNSKITICNKNLLDQNLELFQGNYDNNGNVITNSDRRIDKYIFLAKGNYILWSTINNWINILIYDKNKKLLSIKNSNTNKEIAFTLDEDGYIRFGFNPTVESLKVFQLERNTEKTTSEEHKQQIIVFPFKKGQRLMEGDYLAEDGIHHKRKQIILDEKSLIGLYNHESIDPDMRGFYVSVDGVILNSKIISSHFKNDSLFKTKESRIYCYQNNTIYFIVDKTVADNIDNLKAYIAAQKEAGTPVTVEYELVKEEVETYTDEQKEAWKQINNARSYEGQTNIFSTDEISPNFEVTARRNLNAILNSLQAQILAN